MLTFFFNFTWNCVTKFTQFDNFVTKGTLNIVLFFKTKMSHCFTKYFSCFMSRMHKLQIFREKLQFSCIAFRLENPTQALPSRHWFHHHNSQCFFFNCHVTVVPKSCCLNMLDICLRVFDGTTMICVTIFLVIFANDVKREKKWGKSSKEETVWHQMVTQHQTSSL